MENNIYKLFNSKMNGGDGFSYSEHKNQIKLVLVVICLIALIAIVMGDKSGVPASTMAAVWIALLSVLVLLGTVGMDVYSEVKAYRMAAYV